MAIFGIYVKGGNSHLGLQICFELVGQFVLPGVLVLRQGGKAVCLPGFHLAKKWICTYIYNFTL